MPLGRPVQGAGPLGSPSAAQNSRTRGQGWVRRAWSLSEQGRAGGSQGREAGPQGLRQAWWLPGPFVMRGRPSSEFHGLVWGRGGGQSLGPPAPCCVGGRPLHSLRPWLLTLRPRGPQRLLGRRVSPFSHAAHLAEQRVGGGIARAPSRASSPVGLQGGSGGPAQCVMGASRAAGEGPRQRHPHLASVGLAASLGPRGLEGRSATLAGRGWGPGQSGSQSRLGLPFLRPDRAASAALLLRQDPTRWVVPPGPWDSLRGPGGPGAQTGVLTRRPELGLVGSLWSARRWPLGLTQAWGAAGGPGPCLTQGL